MSVFPVTDTEPLVTIHPTSLEALGAGMMNVFSNNGSLFSAASATYPTANLAILIPFSLTKPITALTMFTYNGATASGNIDVGIYGSSGARLVSKGSTAQSGTNALQTLDITDIEIGPGQFYLAVAMDNTTGTLFRLNSGGQNGVVMGGFGLAQMATAFPLPATVTFASFTANYIPIIGLSTRIVI